MTQGIINSLGRKTYDYPRFLFPYPEFSYAPDLKIPRKNFFDMFLIPALTFLLVLILIPPGRKLALRLGFVDLPGGRKVHDAPVPPVGGLIIFPIYMLGVIAAGLNLSVYWPLLTAISMVLITGMIDDKLHINPWIKFGVQIAAAALIVVGGDHEARLYHLGDLFGGLVGGDVFWLGPLSVIFSITAVVLLVNAINLMDGLDGLAAGMGAVVFFWLIVAELLSGHVDKLPDLLLVTAVLLGFLVYNMRHPWREKACIFMGDSGSMSLGLILAWHCIGMTQGSGAALPPISVAWLLALPIYDTCGQFYRRVREGKHPFFPDRGHFHHHFLDAGIPVHIATPLILLYVFVVGAFGYLGWKFGLPQYVLTALWILRLFLHMGRSYKPQSFINWLALLGKKAHVHS